MNDNDSVSEFLATLRHPQKAEIEALRTIILEANRKIAERIKWNAPSFYYRKDMAAFHLRAKDRVHIVFIFHDGAMIEESAGLLEGDYRDRRMAYFADMEDVRAKQAALTQVVNDWVALMDNSAGEA